MEDVNILIARRRCDLDMKLSISNYKKPTKEELKVYYIDQNMTAGDVAKIYGCHPTTIAVLAGKYGLKKRTGKIDEATLRELYLVKKLQAKEIAAMYGYNPKSIAKYLSTLGIKRKAS